MDSAGPHSTSISLPITYWLAFNHSPSNRSCALDFATLTNTSRKRKKKKNSYLKQQLKSRQRLPSRVGLVNSLETLHKGKATKKYARVTLARRKKCILFIICHFYFDFFDVVTQVMPALPQAPGWQWNVLSTTWCSTPNYFCTLYCIWLLIYSRNICY